MDAQKEWTSLWVLECVGEEGRLETDDNASNGVCLHFHIYAVCWMKHRVYAPRLSIERHLELYISTSVARQNKHIS